MSKKKGSTKGKKSRAQRRASMPPSASVPPSSQASGSIPPESAAASAKSPSVPPPASASKQSASKVAAAKESASKQPLREPKEKLDQKIDALHERIQEKSEAARAGFASDPAIDETSIPPVVEDEFFAKGEEPHRVSHAGASGAFEPIHHDSRGSHRKHTPEAHARRGELAKYVKAAVAVSAAILVAGLVKFAFFNKHDDKPVVANITSAVQAPATQPAPTQPAPTETQVTPPTPPAPTENAVAADAAKAEETALADAGKVEEKTDEKPAEKPARTAAQEKAAAQAALEAGNAGGAIAAGQKSVALDPTDAEAWLILGGAYQMQNRNGEAKAAFQSCVQQAKRGPVGECKQMLQ